MSPKILVIGLDAATMDLVEPWVRQGKLPALGRLMNHGYSSRLISTPNMHSASAWTSILTGLNPGRHGLFVFSDRDPATGRIEFFTGGNRTGQTIAAFLARQGLTAGFLNVPMTYPADESDGGFMISGLDAPELNDLAFQPRELRSELLQRYPGYRYAPTSTGDHLLAGKIEEATREWIELVAVQTDAAEYLIRNRPTDFFMVVYTASDWAGHNLWNRPEAMLAVYQALDDAVARLLTHGRAETGVYVISDHGMGPHTGASYQLADWLQDRGYMIRTANTGGTAASLLARGKRSASAVLPASLKQKLKAAAGPERVKRIQALEKDSFYSSIDWDKTVAYTEPGRHVVNINLAGRNHGGIVSHSDYESTCSMIISELGRWTDEAGNRVVESVATRDQVYRGPFVERASDLYIYWNPNARLGPPPAEVQARGYWWSGDHRPEGILIAWGDGIRSAPATSNPSVCDLVPTIMYGQGLSVPAGLDGRVVEELFTEEFKVRHPIVVQPTDAPGESSAPDLSGDEERMIEEKLRGLGYL